MTTVGNALKSEIAQYAETLARSNDLFLAANSGRLTSDQVAIYLNGILQLIRGTMGVLSRAERRATEMGNQTLAAHYRHKITEESGHDRWAEQDLAGLTASQMTGTAHSDPERAIRKLVAYLHDVVDDDPGLFLAYILLAEYLTVLVGDDWLRAVERSCGIAPSQMSVIANHIELDKEHVPEGVHEIDALVTDPRRLTPMLEVLRMSISYYEEFWSEVAAVPSKAA